MDRLVMTEKLVQQVQLVLLVPLERKVSMERRENRVNQDNLERTVIQDCQEVLDLVDHPVSLVPLQDQLEPRAVQEMLEGQESEVKRDSLVDREHQEESVCQDHQAYVGYLEQGDLEVWKVNQASMDWRDFLVNQDLVDLWGLLAHQVLKGLVAASDLKG